MFCLADSWRRCGAQDPTYTSSGVILVYLECSMELGVCGLLLEERWQWRCRQFVDGITTHSVWCLLVEPLVDGEIVRTSGVELPLPESRIWNEDVVRLIT